MRRITRSTRTFILLSMILLTLDGVLAVDGNQSIVDFTELRNSFGERDDFSEICEDNRPKAEAAGLLNNGEWQAVRNLLGPWLKDCPVDSRAHLYSGAAAIELGDLSAADHHKYWFRGLIDSILSSGDGKSPETAYITISVGEEYDLLSALGLMRKDQTLLLDVTDDNSSSLGEKKSLTT